MNKDVISRMFVDHYLQAALLNRLSNAERALRFSELKEDGIENSLFMYHANKLITRKAIIKNNEGFHLTALGAHWVNSIGQDMTHTQPTARPLIQFIIRDGAANLLLSTRKGQLKELLNDYMLPGGLHKSGLSSDENAKRIAENVFNRQGAEPQFLSVVEVINTYSDGIVYHSLSHIYTLDGGSIASITSDERFNFIWFPIERIRTDNPAFNKSLFLPLLIAKVRDGQLQQREVVRVNYI